MSALGEGAAPISVLLADSSPARRRAMEAVLAQDRGFVLVGEATRGKMTVAMARSLTPRLIALSLDMPDMRGIEVIEQIMARSPTRIVVIAETDDPRAANQTFEALSRGA